MIIRDSGLEEIDRLRDIFNANTVIEKWDPTFKPVDSQEIRRLVLQSEARHEPNAQNFQMQSIYVKQHDHTDGIGYFHIYHGLERAPDLGFISMMVIHPDCQQHGFGVEVVEGVLDFCRHATASGPDRRAIGVRVYLKNWPALRFWTKMGFCEIERIDGDRTHDEKSHASVVLLNRLVDP